MIKITPAFKTSAKVTGDARAALAAELARCYGRNYTIRDLAEATGRSYGWVHNLLEEAGVTLRGRGGAPVRRRPPSQKPRRQTSAAKPRETTAISKPATGASRSVQVPITTASTSQPGAMQSKKRTQSRTECPTGTAVTTPATTARKTGRVDQFNTVLGDELRALRRRRGLTRRQLKDRLPCRDVSLQTLATYELGTRQVAAIRVYQICEALDERVDDLYARVRLRLQLPHAPVELALDLAATATAPDLNLPPVQAWAQAKLSTQPAERLVRLTMSALHNLAALCAMSADELVERLTRAGLTKAIGSPSHALSAEGA